jgi:hypothetical protein
MSQSINQPTDFQRFEFLVNKRYHTEKIFWSRIQTLHAVQAAILAGGFALASQGHRITSFLTFLLGFILTLLISRLAKNDWSDSKVNDTLLESLYRDFNFRRTGTRLCGCLRSHVILLNIIIPLFLIINLVLAVLVLCLNERLLG